jgi:4-hydroxy-tetrahydrodipicolinate synthase
LIDSRLTGGVYAAIVTPFDDGENLDLGAFRAVLEYVVGCGVNGLVVAGTTGEAHALKEGEREALWSAAVKHVRGRCPIIAGTGATTTREALELQRVAAACGCDAALALTPWFEKPSPEGILAYYSDLAEVAELPLLLYHNPTRTGLDWPAEHIAEVALRLEGKAVGVKDSAQDPERVRVIRDGAPPGFLIYSGGAHAREEFRAAGADGCISALACALPAEALEAYRGDPAKREYFGRVAACLSRSQNYVTLLKYMMTEMDLPAGRVRRPHDLLPRKERENAPELRYRGGGSREPPAWDYSAAEVVPLMSPGLLEECLAAEPISGLEVASVYTANAEDYCYNHHAQIAHFDGRYWVGWSAGWCNEDSPGQVVRVSTSVDGKTWTEPEFAMPGPEDSLRWTMGGFWELDGKLHLLAGRATRVRYVDGEVAPGVLWENQWCELFLLEGGKWKPLGRIFEDFYPNELPRRLPGGEWICPGVTSRADVVVYVGAGSSPAGWDRAVISSRTDNYNPRGTKLTEPSWYLCGEKLRVLLRDDARSKLLLLTESRDGRSWSQPVPTDFPDAQSKFRCVNLADGRVAVVSNPAARLDRKCLAVAVSDDGGESFVRLHKLRCDPGMRPRHPGMHKVSGFSYPAALEHGGRLWVACAPNKEDVEVLSVPVDRL